MTNETLRRKIASVVSHRVTQCQNTSIIADAILATIKADDDAKDKRIDELERTGQEYIDALKARIAELERTGQEYIDVLKAEKAALQAKLDRIASVLGDDVWDCPTG